MGMSRGQTPGSGLYFLRFLVCHNFFVLPLVRISRLFTHYISRFTSHVSCLFSISYRIVCLFDIPFKNGHGLLVCCFFNLVFAY